MASAIRYTLFGRALRSCTFWLKRARPSDLLPRKSTSIEKAHRIREDRSVEVCVGCDATFASARGMYVSSRGIYLSDAKIAILEIE